MQHVPPLEAAVAALVTGLDHDTVPAAALAGARRLMQDQLAVQIGCAALPWSRAVLELARTSHAPGRAHVTVDGDTMSAADAAFVNATYGHGFEYDDAHRASSSHPGSCVVPAALALGEELGSTMREVVSGIVAGYEVYTRLGVLAAPDLLERGFHPHAVLSAFGAAAVAARMRGFDTERTLHALSIALSHCSGTTEYTSTGGSVKRLHAGIGTRNGLRAADMAAAGITGPTTFLTGAKGLFHTFAGRPVAADAVEMFSRSGDFEVTRVWIKPYCCCGINHAFIDGARELAHLADDIATVRLGIQTGGNSIVGSRNAHAYAPQTIEHLQYSLPFQFALALLGLGNGFTTHHDYLTGHLDLSSGSPAATLARRVRIEVDSRLDTEYPGRWVGDITVTHGDRTETHLFVENPRGTAENPMAPDDLDAKFHDLTAAALGPERADTLMKALTAADPSTPVGEFTALLRR
ncbi:MmgE/PrpD family protein [Nocardia sp. alder85J]|uniref:MmgE/PrpD family protein n=1 Tax=Nocardia sp. alder85J TaxID=2862949 RepID=UPI001CD59738|nr:MmgE/PrpD family protein [Nocardia sp. alder85J]MCX4095577.1 MmgE/PrpD family protein [Nocardia sp. alder85J]